jgi:hypothetical protein
LQQSLPHTVDLYGIKQLMANRCKHSAVRIRATEVWREDGKGVGIYVAAASIVVFAGRKAKAPVRYGVTGAVSNHH